MFAAVFAAESLCVFVACVSGFLLVRENHSAVHCATTSTHHQHNDTLKPINHGRKIVIKFIAPGICLQTYIYLCVIHHMHALYICTVAYVCVDNCCMCSVVTVLACVMLGWAMSFK